MLGRGPSKPGSSSAATGEMAPRPVASRTVGHTQECLLLVLVIGFLLIFSYQSEIYTVLAGRDGYAPAADGNKSFNRSLKSPDLRGAGRSDAKADTESTARSREEKVVLAATEIGVLPGRKLEANESSGQAGAPSQPPPPPPEKKNKYDKRWKDVKIEAYMPLVETVQSNTLGANFQFVIKVLSLNNNRSLVRCLTSLSEAEYAGDPVDIHIYIDHFEIEDIGGSHRRILAAKSETDVLVGEMKDGSEKGAASISQAADRTKKGKGRKKSGKKSSSSGRTASSSRRLEDESASEEPRVPDRLETGNSSVKQNDWRQVEEKLSDARRVLDYVESFRWKFGKKVIHYRTRTAGSQSQWLDAWWPSSDDEFALFVEDDAEVSPLFYRYARALIATYYYNSSHYDRSMYGISLQRPQIVPGKNGRALKVDDRTRLFKYQMVGIWGQIFFPKPWKEFRMWYDTQKSHDVKPVVDGMVTTDWYRQFGEKMFTPWFVKFAYNRGYFNLYTNFLRDRVLSVTHRDGGMKTKNYAGCDSVLIWNNGTYDIDLWHMAANWNIKKYDYCFKEVRVGRFANAPSQVSWVADSTQENKRILMVSTFGVPEHMVRNWLCRLRKLGIQNYLVVGEDPMLLEDLARRGHATMRIEDEGEYEEHVEWEVNAVSKILDLGHDVWFIRADTIWVGNPLTLTDTVGADVIGVENSELNLFFIRRTEETALLWGSLKQELSKVPVNVSRIQNWERTREVFVKACQEEEKVKMGTLEQVIFINGDNLDGPPTLESSGGSSTDAQVVVLSGLRSSSDWEIKKKMRQLNVWNLDDDLACAELTC